MLYNLGHPPSLGQEFTFSCTLIMSLLKKTHHVSLRTSSFIFFLNMDYFITQPALHLHLPHLKTFISIIYEDKAARRSQPVLWKPRCSWAEVFPPVSSTLIICHDFGSNNMAATCSLCGTGVEATAWSAHLSKALDLWAPQKVLPALGILGMAQQKKASGS